MAQQNINIGTVANDGTGDNPRATAIKINANFTENYASIALKANTASPIFTGTPAAPTATAGTNTTQLATTAFTTAAVSTALAAPVPQFNVAASGTLALTATHQGGTIILAGTGATVSMNATTVGDGYVFKVINDTGADWTVPTFTGGTNRFDTAGNTKVSAGGSASFETFTRASVRYVHVVGTTA